MLDEELTPEQVMYAMQKNGEIAGMGYFLRRDRRNYGGEGVDHLTSIIRSLFPFLSISITQEVNFPDISFYQGAPNFETMVGMTRNVIIRAGQNVWKDSQFDRNYAEAKAKCMRRGVYFFYDDRASPEAQAAVLIPMIRDDKPELGVFVDWENTYSGAYGGLANVVKFMQLVEAGAGVTCGMYTGYYWFKDHSNASTNAKEYAYLKTRPLWLAWYTTNPAYVSIPAPWSSLTFWQYGTPAIGSKYGVNTTEIDMNWYNGSLSQFNAAYPPAGGSVPPPPTGTDFPFDGAIHTKLRNYGSDVHLFLIQKARMEVYQSISSSGKATVLAMATKTGAQIAVNGGDYDPYTGDPTGLLAVNGVIKSLKEGYMPWLNITSDNKPSIEDWNSTVQPYNAVALRRMLVVDGKVSPNTSAAWYERHPKTAYGVNARGELIIVEVDGRTDQSAGVNLFELAQLCIDAGAVRAGDAGGGGDCTVVINGVVVNVPIADTTPGELRPVADAVIAFKLDGGGTVALGSAKEALGKIVTVRTSPQVVSGNGTSETVPSFGTINFAKIVPDLQHPNDPNYQWLQMDAAGTRFVNYYYPSTTLQTLKRFNILSMPTEPTTTPFTFTISIDGYKTATITGNLEKV